MTFTSLDFETKQNLHDLKDLENILKIAKEYKINIVFKNIVHITFKGTILQPLEYSQDARHYIYKIVKRIEWAREPINKHNNYLLLLYIANFSLMPKNHIGNEWIERSGGICYSNYQIIKEQARKLYKDFNFNCEIINNIDKKNIIKLALKNILDEKIVSNNSICVISNDKYYFKNDWNN